MKLIFRDDNSIISVLSRSIEKAVEQGKFVEKVVLTPAEWKLFAKEAVEAAKYQTQICFAFVEKDEIWFRGFLVVREKDA